MFEDCRRRHGGHQARMGWRKGTVKEERRVDWMEKRELESWRGERERVWKKDEDDRKRDFKKKRPSVVLGLLAILQTNPDWKCYCCAAGCWDGGLCSASQPLLTLEMYELVITSPTILFLLCPAALTDTKYCDWRLKLEPQPCYNKLYSKVVAL